MNLIGNQRGGASDLARHLLKTENEKVVVYEIRGFASGTLSSALQESYAISRQTKCKQHLFSLSLNPPKDAKVSPETFVDAIQRAEERLGLQGQPRAIVFHEKIGWDGELRRHAHAVWCRIDAEAMKAVQMSFFKRKLNNLGRELFLEHGWTMPKGYVRSQDANPLNYTLAEWQQAKRAKTHPTKIKEVFQDCWAISDNQAAFAQALKEQGYVLARGDRRGVVAVDFRGEVYAVSRYVGIKAKQVRAKIGDGANLPHSHRAKQEAASMVADRLRQLQKQQKRTERQSQAILNSEIRRKRDRHRQESRQFDERLAARFPNGGSTSQRKVPDRSIRFLGLACWQPTADDRAKPVRSGSSQGTRPGG